MSMLLIIALLLPISESVEAEPLSSDDVADMLNRAVASVDEDALGVFAIALVEQLLSRMLATKEVPRA